MFFSIKSASLFIKTPRAEADIFRHAPFSNAARAAATALSTSAASASATCVITSPVEGLIVGNVFPDAASTHLLLINNFVALTLTLGSITEVAVAIMSSLPDRQKPIPPCPPNQQTTVHSLLRILCCAPNSANSALSFFFTLPPPEIRARILENAHRHESKSP